MIAVFINFEVQPDQLDAAEKAIREFIDQIRKHFEVAIEVAFEELTHPPSLSLHNTPLHCLPH